MKEKSHLLLHHLVITTVNILLYIFQTFFYASVFVLFFIKGNHTCCFITCFFLALYCEYISISVTIYIIASFLTPV